MRISDDWQALDALRTENASLSRANYDYCTENALLKEERDELRKALEPLVDQWNALCQSPDATHEGLEDRLEVMLRRAARSLSFKKEA